jgi:toxin ParE1/3/4
MKVEKIHYRSQALFDLEEIFQYINQRSPGGARNVIGAIHDAIAQIAEHPLSTERASHPGIHVKVVRRYPYKIFYRVGVDYVEILHVRHGARRPWLPSGFADAQPAYVAEQS